MSSSNFFAASSLPPILPLDSFSYSVLSVSSVVKSFPCWSWWTLGVLRAASGPPYGLTEDEIRIVEGGP